MRRLAQLCVVATACAMHDLDQISVHELPDGSPWLAGDWVARRRLGGVEGVVGPRRRARAGPRDPGRRSCGAALLSPSWRIAARRRRAAILWTRRRAPGRRRAAPARATLQARRAGARRSGGPVYPRSRRRGGRVGPRGPRRRDTLPTGTRNRRGRPVWKSTSVSGAPANSSLSHFSAINFDFHTEDGHGPRHAIATRASS